MRKISFDKFVVLLLLLATACKKTSYLNATVTSNLDSTTVFLDSAYAIDFLSRERVIVASADLVRIPDYQQRVDEHGVSAYNLPRIPCRGEQVASWCIQPP